MAINETCMTKENRQGCYKTKRANNKTQQNKPRGNGKDWWDKKRSWSNQTDANMAILCDVFIFIKHEQNNKLNKNALTRLNLVCEDHNVFCGLN